MAFVTKLSKRHLATSAILQQALKNVVVIGGGLMGGGIAQVSAQTGHQVILVDMSEDILKKTLNTIKLNVQKIAKKQLQGDTKAEEKFVEDTMSQFVINTSPERAVLNADIVIEAIVENIDFKRKLFSNLEKAAPKNTIFVTNTSSIPVSEIADATKRKDKFAGLHFFNPVPIMKLVEIARIPETSDETYNKVLEFSKALGKIPVTCKDTPGFIVNRLLFPYFMEAIRMLERGDASAEHIDLAMKLGAGYPMGPFELIDFIGLDTVKSIMDGWSRRFPNQEMYRPSPLLDRLIRDGKRGRKSGEGFYKHEG